MHTFEALLLLMLGSVALTALARRISAPYPALLALGGALLVFLPGAPDIRLEPQLALALFVAPILLDTAFDASLRELKDNAWAIASLSVGAVLTTVIAVALAARWIVPEMPWPAALALGAIVSPPDAVAATAVLRQLKPPHRNIVILEGESLFNDAPALLVLSLAILAVAGNFQPATDLPYRTFLATVGSVAAGWGLARVWGWIIRRPGDAPSQIILQFVGAFGVWIIAERLHLSAVLTVVTFALVAAERSLANTAPQNRVPSFAVWEAVIVVLSVLAFTLLGLQLRPLLGAVADGERLDAFWLLCATFGATLVARFAWVFAEHGLVRLKNRLFGMHLPHGMSPPTAGGALLTAWCGMRGVVTVAAALSLPADFPQRDLIQLVAFGVVLATLTIQGLTLAPLLRLLKLEDDNPVEREAGLARREAYQAALASLGDDQSAEAKALRREYELVLDEAARNEDGAAPEELPHDELRRRAIAAGRDRVLDMRQKGEIGDEAFRRVEEQLDWAELNATPTS